MRAIKVFSLVTILWTIAAIGQAQFRPFGAPNIPQPYIPPAPNIPRPGIPNFQPPQAPVFVKRCMHCGHEVPASSMDGQMCPYCGVIWGSTAGISSGDNNGNTTQETVTTVVKQCTHCGAKVPESSHDGQVCPRCGVTWGKGAGNGLSVRTTTVTRRVSPNGAAANSGPTTAPVLGFAIGNDTFQSVAFALECVGGVLMVVGAGIGLWKWNQKRVAGGAAAPRAPGSRSGVGMAGAGRTKLPDLPATFLPETEPPASSTAATPPAASPSKTEWLYFVDGQQHGPVSSQELRRLAAAGKLAPTDLVWREGLAEWAPAAKLKGLFPVSGKNA